MPVISFITTKRREELIAFTKIFIMRFAVYGFMKNSQILPETLRRNVDNALSAS